MCFRLLSSLWPSWWRWKTCQLPNIELVCTESYVDVPDFFSFADVSLLSLCTDRFNEQDFSQTPYSNSRRWCDHQQPQLLDKVTEVRIHSLQESTAQETRATLIGVFARIGPHWERNKQLLSALAELVVGISIFLCAVCSQHLVEVAYTYKKACHKNIFSCWMPGEERALIGDIDCPLMHGDLQTWPQLSASTRLPLLQVFWKSFSQGSREFDLAINESNCNQLRRYPVRSWSGYICRL